jgi:6,7-dimethyl-8-ribityllumazine synthase
MIQRRGKAKTASKPRSRTSSLEGPRVLVVEARYYDEVSNELLAGATAALEKAGAVFDVVTVPGALEVPAAIVIALDAAKSRRRPYEAAVALGCVIRGDTGHYDFVAGESARAIMYISVARALPVGNGILTVNTEEQALARARVSDLDKGGGAAEAALTLVALRRRLAGKG